MLNLDWRRAELVVFDVDGTLYDQSCLRRRMIRQLLLHCLRRPRQAAVLRGAHGAQARARDTRPGRGVARRINGSVRRGAAAQAQREHQDQRVELLVVHLSYPFPIAPTQFVDQRPGVLFL